MTGSVKSQTGHQHQGGFVVAQRTVRNRFRYTAFAFGEGVQIRHMDEPHIVAVAFGQGDPLSVLQRLVQNGECADFLVVADVTVDGFGIPIELGVKESHGQHSAFFDDGCFCHGPFLAADMIAKFRFGHGFPREDAFPWRAGTA